MNVWSNMDEPEIWLKVTRILYKFTKFLLNLNSCTLWSTREILLIWTEFWSFQLKFFTHISPDMSLIQIFLRVYIVPAVQGVCVASRSLHFAIRIPMHFTDRIDKRGCHRRYRKNKDTSRGAKLATCHGTPREWKCCRVIAILLRDPLLSTSRLTCVTYIHERIRLK